MAEYSRLAKGRVLSTGGVTPVVLPFRPDMVEIVNFTASGTPTSGGVARVYWDSLMGEGASSNLLFNATPVLTSANITSGGISTFAAGLMFQYGPQQQIVSITKASPAVVTVTAHGLATGDVIILEGLYQSATTGMVQISNMPFVVTVSDANTFTIPYNTNLSNFTALSASPAGAFIRKVLYPFLYVPGVSFISAITRGATTTVTTTAPHNMVVGQQVAFRIPNEYGTIQLNSLPNVNIPGSPIYGYVVSVTNATTVVVNINSSAFSAFTPNVTFARTLQGLTPPQMVAVGDVNTGGWPIDANSQLYPSPLVNGVRTINGPAIQGAFINNTRQGFVIGAAVAGAVNDVLYYRAYLHDVSST